MVLAPAVIVTVTRSAGRDSSPGNAALLVTDSILVTLAVPPLVSVARSCNPMGDAVAIVGPDNVGCDGIGEALVEPVDAGAELLGEADVGWDVPGEVGADDAGAVPVWLLEPPLEWEPPDSCTRNQPPTAITRSAAMAATAMPWGDFNEFMTHLLVSDKPVECIRPARQPNIRAATADGTAMTLTDYLVALRQRIVAIAVFALLGALAGFSIGKTTAPTYRANSEVFVTVTNGSTIDDLVQGSTFTQNLVQSYAKLATSRAVLLPVIDKLKLDTTVGALSKRVTAETPINTVIISISASAGTASEAADIANAIAAQLPSTVTSLTPTSRSSSGTQVNLSTIASASLPKYPVSPNTKLYMAIGLVLGAVVGVAYALLRRVTNTRVRGEDEITDLTSAPILGSIPSWRSGDRVQVPLLTGGVGPRSEAYRRLRSNLEFVRADDHRWSTLVITSAAPGDGKSTTAINLALAIAEHGDKVLLVDADLRRPTISSVTGLESGVGLSSVLIDKVKLTGAVQLWDDRLDVMTSGPIPPNPLQLIDSSSMEKFLTEASAVYDYIIIDAPPLISVVDAAVLARHTDGALLVTRSGGTKRRQLGLALESLSVAGVTPTGVVLTRVSDSSRGGYYHYQQNSKAGWRGQLSRLWPFGR